MRRIIKEYWPFAAVLGLLAAMLLFSGCKGLRSIPVAHDTIYISNEVYRDVMRHDSIFIHDSMWVEMKGDTMWVDHWHTKYVERIVRDTLSRRDTSYVVKEVPMVEYKIKKVYLWWPSVLVLAVLGIGGCYWYYKRRRLF